MRQCRLSTWPSTKQHAVNASVHGSMHASIAVTNTNHYEDMLKNNLNKHIQMNIHGLVVTYYSHF